MRYVEEFKLQELQAKLAEIDENELRSFLGHANETPLSLEKCIEEYPIEVIFLICKNICSKEDITKDCFYRLTHNAEGFLNGALINWRDSAAIVFNHIKFRGEEKKDEKEYVSLIEFVEKSCDLNRNWILRAKSECLGDARRRNRGCKLSTFLDLFFQIFVREIQRFLYHLCWLIYRGLPIYEKTTADKFTLVRNDNLDYIYLFMNGLYRSCPVGQSLHDQTGASINYHENFCIPSWATDYFLNVNQLSLFREFFHDYDFDDERTIQLRREAYRRAIGLEDVFANSQDNGNKKLESIGKPEECYQTHLMEIQQKVLQRYYGDQFDLKDSSTWTSQIAVVEWLTKEFRLSKRAALSIDIITRPDAARGK